MNIALITYDFYPNTGGMAHVLTSFCKSFPKNEHNLYVFTILHEDKKIYNILDRNLYNLNDLFLFFKRLKLLKYLFLSFWKIISTKRIKSSDKIMIILNLIIKPKELLKTVINITAMYKILKNLKIDIILGGLTDWKTLDLTIFLSSMLKTKRISFSHGNDFLFEKKLTLKSYYLKNLDRIIVATNAIKNILQRIHHLSDKKIDVKRFGLIFDQYKLEKSKNELRKDFNIPLDAFVILSVGRHISRKRFDLVIRAIKEIKNKNPKINLLYFLLGEGEETKKLTKLSKELNLEENIIFKGFVDNEVRNKFYKLSDLFLMPSIAEKDSIEGFGIVFLEANYYKTPVIGTYSGGMVESIIDGDTGLLIEQNNLEELIEKILFFYSNKEKRKEMGKKGYNRVISEYDWNKNIYEYIELFNKILKE